MFGQGSNRQKSLRHGSVMAVLVVAFLISGLVSVAQLNQSLSIIESREGSSIWSIAQLRSQLQRFNDALFYYHDDPDLLLNLQKRYDLLWSHFPTLLDGKDGEGFSKGGHKSHIIEAAFTAVKAQEQLIFQELASDPALALIAREALMGHQRAIERASLERFHLSSRTFNGDYSAIIDLHKQLGFLIMGLIVTGAIFLHMVWKSNRRNHHQALHDGLTNLPNRDFLHLHVDELCDKAETFAMHMIDLNGFKHINDSLGHKVGDALLKVVGERIAGSLDQYSVVCRLGGDEFAVVQRHVTEAAQAIACSERIIAALAAEFKVDQHICKVGASIGTVLSPEHGSQASSLLARADMAMYEAKAKGPESACLLFNMPIEDKQVYRHQLSADLREAIANNALHMNYQPIASLRGGHVRSMEALLRWHHPKIGFISPLEIVEVAELYGMANELGCWIIEEVCRQKREWLNQGYDLPPVSINISPSMYRLDLADTIFNLLDKYQLKDGSIWIEVTEDTTMNVIQQAQPMLAKLSSRGVAIALDDFGTGLSSLSHLRDLNFQALKIDRSFVKDICNSEACADLLKNIIAIGQDLGMRVIAEGIEDNDIAFKLIDFGCNYGQGYLFSKPLPPALVPEFCEQQVELPAVGMDYVI